MGNLGENEKEERGKPPAREKEGCGDKEPRLGFLVECLIKDGGDLRLPCPGHVERIWVAALPLVCARAEVHCGVRALDCSEGEERAQGMCSGRLSRGLRGDREAIASWAACVGVTVCDVRGCEQKGI